MSRSPQDVYARHLLSSRGYPLWIPEPSHQVLLYRPDGLRIGDVGVVVPEDGGFEVFFNICLPREHPFHRATGVPDNFKHVELRDEDIRVIPNVEPPSRIISTSSVTKIRTVDLPSDTPGPQLGGLARGYEFDLSSSEGALLILPEGAARYDLRNRRLFFDEATRRAVDWYRFAEEHLGRMISHDSLYLITGFYKASSWSLAAFENAAGSGEFSAQCKVAQVGGGNIGGTYTWETTRALDWRVGPLENYGIPNQSVFIRGFKIALRADFLGKTRIEVKVDAPDTHSKHETFFHVVKRDSWISRLWKGSSRDSRPGPSTGSTTDQASDNSPSGGPQSDAGKHVVIQTMPESSQIFHPSDIINQYLLTKETSADVAVTHDDDWLTILRKVLQGHLKPEDLVQANPSRVEAIISNIFQVVSQGGAAFLRVKSDAGAEDNKTTLGTMMDEYEAIHEHQAPVVQDASFEEGISTQHANEVIATDAGPDELVVEKPPVPPSVGTQRTRDMENEKFDPPLDVEPPPVYETESPSHTWSMDTEEKSHLLSDSLRATDFTQTLGIHRLLLPYDPRKSKHLLRFDIILPVNQICYQYSDNIRERLTEEDLDALASAEPITKMRITFEQWPFNWTIDVDNPNGIRCRHVFEAIYNSFQQQLTLGELWRVPDRQACEDAFRLRTLVLGSPQTDQSLGWKRVDVLLHHTIFHGLTMHTANEKGSWVLNLGAPMPVARATDSPSLSFFRRDSSLTPEGSAGSSDDDGDEYTPFSITSAKRGLAPPPACDLAPPPPFSRPGPYPTEATATRASLPISVPAVLLRQQTERSRPTHRPLGPRQRPNA